MYNPPEIARNAKTPTVLIAGGAGYLGTALCESLLSRNLRVVVIDNLETGKQKNIEPYLSHPRFAFFEYDLNKGLPEKIKSADMIFHLAAHETYLDTPDEKVALDGLLTNALATHHLLEFAKDCSARFIFASTVDIYQGIVSGTDLKHYFGPTENDEKIFSHTEAKRFAESLVWEYFKKYNLDVRLVRLGNLYGPGMNLSTAEPLGKFLKELLAGHNLFVEGDGLEKDYYCYLQDAVSGLVSVAFNDKARGNIYPITDPQPATVLELAYIIKKYARPVTEVVFKPSSRKYHLPDVRVIDTQKLKELPWLPQTDLKQGVFLTLKALGYLPAENAASSPEIAPPPTPKKTVPERINKTSLLNFSLPRPPKNDKPRASSPRSKLSWLAILALLALAHAAQGDIPPALVSLERALTLAEPEGYVRIFVDEGEAMRLLIEKQSRNRDHPLSGYADKLLAAFTQPVAAPKSAIIHQKSDMIEPLSERELEVLKLLRSELSGPEIARELMVSLNTMRTHTNNIFNKLGVNNRRAAVRRAEELDLL